MAGLQASQAQSSQETLGTPSGSSARSGHGSTVVLVCGAGKPCRQLAAEERAEEKDDGSLCDWQPPGQLLFRKLCDLRKQTNKQPKNHY